MGMTWGSYFGVDFTQDAVAGSGLTMMAGIKTLDTSIIGAIIISGIVTALHNRLFDKKLPVFLGIFQGTSYVVIIAFLVMIPCAWLTLLGWPKVQMGIESLQAFLRSAGALGVWVYTTSSTDRLSLVRQLLKAAFRCTGRSICKSSV